MKVYAVIEYDQYYPCSDNVVKMFKSKDEAEVFLKDFTSNHDYIEIIEYEVEE